MFCDYQSFQNNILLLKFMKIFSLFVAILFCSNAYCQQLRVVFKSQVINANFQEDIDLVIPIVITIDKTTLLNNSTENQLTLSVVSDKDQSDIYSYSNCEFEKMKFTKSVIMIDATKKVNSDESSFLVIPKMNYYTDGLKSFYVHATIDGVLVAKCRINVNPSDDIIYKLDTYLNKENIKLKSVTKVESDNDILTVSGFSSKHDVFTKRKIRLEKGQVFTVSDRSHIFQGRSHWYKIPISLVTIPFKVRPSAQKTITKAGISKDSTFSSSSSSGLSNVGINVDLFRKTYDRYFSSGKKATHKLSLGAFVAPGVEELISSSIIDDSLIGDRKSRQAFVSSGLTISYSYNGLTLIAVPAAADWATSTLGKKWIYHGKYWWGFGIGVNPILFGQIFNK